MVFGWLKIYESQKKTFLIGIKYLIGSRSLNKQVMSMIVPEWSSVKNKT